MWMSDKLQFVMARSLFVCNKIVGSCLSNEISPQTTSPVRDGISPRFSRVKRRHSIIEANKHLEKQLDCHFPLGCLIMN